MDASGQGLGAVLLQGCVSNEELKQASQTDGKYLKFRNKLNLLHLLVNHFQRLNKGIQTLKGNS